MELHDVIETAFSKRQELSPYAVDQDIRSAVEKVMHELEKGTLRVAEKINGEWKTHEWIKKAVLLSFRINENKVMDGGFTRYYDKVPLQYSNLAANTVLMPSYVNIGAYIDTGCMIDTWATVGSCAQIGKNVHISGGAGIGGVLEPLQASPTIIEDGCFIGARSEIVEGVIVEEGSVISMGVYIGSSTKIYHRESGEVHYGKVPAGSVVVPGNLPAKDGSHSLYCAVIVKQVDAKTRAKTSINELLRNIDA